MRVFKLDIGGEYETLAANSKSEAIEFYLEITGNSVEEVINAEEIPKSEWDSVVVTNPDYNPEDELDQPSYTIAEMMEGLKYPTYLYTSYIG